MTTHTCTTPNCNQTTVARRLCRKHYQAAWKAGHLDHHEKQPPRVRNRTICPPEHRHQLALTCYNLHQCRCTPCTEHRAASDTRRAKDKAYGRYNTGLVDVTPVREHLLMLGEYGLGYKRVAALAGLGITPVRNVLWGRQDPGPRKGEMQKRVKRETAIRILSVQPTLEHLADGAHIPARGAQRRVQALVARGWSQSKVATLIAVSPANFTTLMKRDRIQVATHRSIAAVYDELWNQSPPETVWRDKIAASRARNHATTHGWAPPMAWDDIDNDPAPDHGMTESGYIIDEMAVDLAVSGIPVKLHPTERREAIVRLHRLRLADSRIARQLRCADRTVLRIREELNLPAWAAAEMQDGRLAA